MASRLASWDEVRRLVGVMGDLGAGIFELDQRAGLGGGPRRRRTSTATGCGALAVDSGRAGDLRRLGRPDGRDMLRLIDDTVAAGGRMFGQTPQPRRHR